MEISYRYKKIILLVVLGPVLFIIYASGPLNLNLVTDVIFSLLPMITVMLIN